MGRVSEAVSRELAALLDAAQCDEKCLAADGRRMLRALECRVRTGELVSPTANLFARREPWESLRPDERARWVLRGLHDEHPSWEFCGTSAAVLHGLSVSWDLVRAVHLAVPQNAYCASSTLTRHPMGNVEVDVVDGVPVTPLLRTAFDCMRWLDFREGLAVADSALRVGGISREELAGYVGRMRGGYHGIAQARMTAAHADARSENGGESIARAAMWELGFAIPDLQVEVPSPFSGSGLYRVDFRWRLSDGTEVYGEHDGDEKYLNPQMNGGSPLRAMKRERRRESGLTVSHASVMRFSPADVADTAYFDWLLRYFGVPREREPLIEVPAAGGIIVPEPPTIELVPVEAYGLA